MRLMNKHNIIERNKNVTHVQVTQLNWHLLLNWTRYFISCNINYN